MYHSPKWFHLTKNLEPSLLAEEKETLLTRHLKVKDINSLHGFFSLQKIDRHNCFFRSGLQLLRWIFFIPMLIVLLVNLVSFYHAFQNSWIHVEREILSTINEIDTRSYPSENGFGVFFNKEEDQEFRKEQIGYIGNDKKMELGEYMYFRYNIYAYGYEYFCTDIIYAIYYIIFIPLCFYLSFLIKRKAPLILVRNRQLFMTWINGKAFVARYSQVGVVETPQAVSLILYGLDDKKNIIKTAFVLPTNPTIIISTKQGRKNILAFITKYMLWGQSAVASTDYERNIPYYLRKDKKPDDFEQQVSDVLAVLDKQDLLKIE
ncbi:hypothetical protein [Hafnia paralvei]|uniref:Uncharacterized protein n=1 Tax=Hafnia paralvei TaxID=546367 RepID=A0A4Q9EMN3_9GAMM|nr:hypothetical protein [Hafnia paralvei]TBM26939.1 hypothetical protein EYY89_10195 [Hafnia paralvei]